MEVSPPNPMEVSPPPPPIIMSSVRFGFSGSAPLAPDPLGPAPKPEPEAPAPEPEPEGTGVTRTRPRPTTPRFVTVVVEEEASLGASKGEEEEEEEAPASTVRATRQIPFQIPAPFCVSWERYTFLVLFAKRATYISAKRASLDRSHMLHRPKKRGFANGGQGNRRKSRLYTDTVQLTIKTSFY
eukprot:554921-Prorocentrum_minimum.AAC.1